MPRAAGVTAAPASRAAGSRPCAPSSASLQDAALTGLRAAVWVPVENGLYWLAKLVLLVAGAGVFVSWTAPVSLILVPVTVLLPVRVLPDTRTTSPPSCPHGAS